MSLFKRNTSKKRTQSEQLRYDRMTKSATSPNTINYTSLYENGLMHIVENEYSRMIELGDLSYRVADEEDQENIVVSYAEALNTLDKNTHYQLYVVNKRIDNSLLDNILIPLQEDGLDVYRNEMNKMVTKHFNLEQKKL